MAVRRVAWSLIVVAAFGSLISACGSGYPDPQSACDQALAQAMAIDPGSDTVEAIDGAIAGCSSLEAWVAAARQYPDAFGGRNPVDVARDRCATSTQLTGASVCADLAAVTIDTVARRGREVGA